MSDDNLQVLSTEFEIQGEQKSIAVSQLCDPNWVKASPQSRKMANLPEFGPVELLKVYGICTGLTEEKELPQQDGRPPRKTWGLKGKWEAANMMTGEVVQGSEYYMPDGFQERRINDIRDLVKQAKGSPVEIELAHTWTVFGTKSPAGYAWRLFDLAPPKQTDRMARLRAKALSFSTAQLMLTLNANNGASPDGIVIEQKPQQIEAAE